eukprot:2170214-Amphidinium_carterae.1
MICWCHGSVFLLSVTPAWVCGSHDTAGRTKRSSTFSRAEKDLESKPKYKEDHHVAQCVVKGISGARCVNSIHNQDYLQFQR